MGCLQVQVASGESLSLVQHGERLGEPTLSQDRAFHCFTSQGQDFCPRNLFLASSTDLVHSVTQRRPMAGRIPVQANAYRLHTH